LCSAAHSAPALRQAIVGRTGVTACVEDERHFLLECPAYDDIRTQFRLLPQQPWAVDDPGACMRQFFAHSDQSAVARMVFAMRAHRASLLGIPFWHNYA
jgi:hypothetical protein